MLSFLTIKLSLNVIFERLIFQCFLYNHDLSMLSLNVLRYMLYICFYLVVYFFIHLVYEMSLLICIVLIYVEYNF